jgi:PAS domain S-box-containing protein
MQSPPEHNRQAHLLALITAGLAVVMALLTPFWAVTWYRTPFLGLLLEPNNVVSAIASEGWPARASGIDLDYNRLLALNGRPTPDADSLTAILQEDGTSPVRATFARRDGTEFELTITPLAHPPFADLLTLFIIPYIVGLAFLVIGLWTYSLRRDLRASRALLVFTSGLSIVTTTFLDMNTTRHAVLFWALSLGLIGASLTHLALVFPQPIRFLRRWPRARWIPWFIYLALVPSTVTAILRPADPYFYINTWQWGYLFITVAVLLFLVTLTWRIVRTDQPFVRQQSRVMIFGAIIAFAPALYYITPLAFGVVTNFYAWLIFPALVVFPLSITYAILRYRLLDVDRIFSRALGYLLAIGVALTLFYGLLTLFSLFVNNAVRSNDPLVVASYLLLLVIGFAPLRVFIQRAIDRLFYRSPADYRRALTSLSRGLVITPDLTQTLRTLEEHITLALAPDKFGIHLYNDQLGEYLPHSTREDSAPPYQVDDPLVAHLASSRAPVWLPPNAPFPAPLQDSANAYKRLLGFTLVPLHYEGRLIGFMSLGPRRSGDLYNSDDLDFLAAVAAQSTLALENARLFANLRRTLDQTLEMKSLMDDIFASIATGVITTDLKRRITLLNRAAESILGVDVSQMTGQLLATAIPELNVELDGTLERGETLMSEELSRTLPSRGDLYLRLSVSPLLDAQRATNGATIVFEDLTERRKIEAERERIKQTFGRVVAPRVRDRLLANPDNLNLDGAKQLVTILFADLSGFTTYSEKNPPEAVFKVLNTYLALAAQSILNEEGTLDKFMGDAVLAIWNSPDPQPDHALRAVRAALAIVQGSSAAHHVFADPEQHMTFRIGITTGSAMIGNVGTDQLFNYTAIGDTVNLAQRLQASAESGQILLEKSTFDILSEQIIASPLDPVVLKGRARSTQVYELKGLK